jgi:hypothetical protein
MEFQECGHPENIEHVDNLLEVTKSENESIYPNQHTQ